MLDTEFETVKLRDDFYRDGFYRILFSLLTMIGAITLLVLIFLYLYFTEPKPVTFITGPEFRLVPDVPVNQPYLNPPELLQWVSEAIPQAFTNDFINYDTKLNANRINFTDNGWKVYNDFASKLINKDTLNANKYFASAKPQAAPIITNQGILQNRYSWWITIPLSINYLNFEKSTTDDLKLQVLVTRIPTLNNLDGVAIENIIMSK